MAEKINTSQQEQLALAAQWLAEANHVAVFTGAGVSKESGIPTFRDAQTGLWANYSPEDLASRPGFLKNPRMVWEWYDSRRNKVWDVEPNDGHRALVALEKWIETQPGKQFTLITQNIDNLHQRAGSRNVLELHGNIFRYKCLDQNHPYRIPEGPLAEDAELPPRCEWCDSMVRPDVVWFGEMLPDDILPQSYQVAREADVMLVIGTSCVVYPAADIPVTAKKFGRRLIEINPEESALSPMVDLLLKGPSAVLLRSLQNEFLETVVG